VLSVIQGKRTAFCRADALGNCQNNIQITNPGMFEANDQIEQKAQD
jgi:hypothetical protein